MVFSEDSPAPRASGAAEAASGADAGVFLQSRRKGLSFITPCFKLRATRRLNAVPRWMKYHYCQLVRGGES